jgi:hypothetical protein
MVPKWSGEIARALKVLLNLEVCAYAQVSGAIHPYFPNETLNWKPRWKGSGKLFMSKPDSLNWEKYKLWNLESISNALAVLIEITNDTQ